MNDRYTHLIPAHWPVSGGFNKVTHLLHEYGGVERHRMRTNLLRREMIFHAFISKDRGLYFFYGLRLEEQTSGRCRLAIAFDGLERAAFSIGNHRTPMGL